MGAAAKPPAEAVAIMAATRLLEPTVAVSSTLYLAVQATDWRSALAEVLFTSRSETRRKTQPLYLLWKLFSSPRKNAEIALKAKCL